MKVEINISQGHKPVKDADVNVIIDVLRAFSVTFEAINNGVNKIILTGDENEAFLIKKENPTVLLSGEVGGLKIPGFDFGNSPDEIANSEELPGKTLVQKTTNGVTVTLLCLNASQVFVTGLSNAYTTAKYIRKLIAASQSETVLINLVASHPDADEDLACADYMKGLILGSVLCETGWNELAANRVIRAEASLKYFSDNTQEFSVLDILRCALPKKSNFVMQVLHSGKKVKVVKQEVEV
ncbi:MAG: 2-phosphosulfolactate phosphatase [Methyloprofundus sp.]|nr:2-phosphosulfolactate phosphatase [Methyloprofundus sp.]